MTTHAYLLLEPERHELQRCLALLADAIARADRWYARREGELATYDRRSMRRVDRLRRDGRVQASLHWHPARAA